MTTPPKPFPPRAWPCRPVTPVPRYGATKAAKWIREVLMEHNTAIEGLGARINDAVSTLNDSISALGDAKVDAVPGKGLSTNDYTTEEKAKLAASITGASYDSETRKIVFTGPTSGDIEIDATPFVKDGMVSSVAIENGNLVVTFNTDSGASPVSIPLTDIFNPANYYTKAETDAALAPKRDKSDLAYEYIPGCPVTESGELLDGYFIVTLSTGETHKFSRIENAPVFMWAYKSEDFPYPWIDLGRIYYFPNTGTLEFGPKNLDVWFPLTFDGNPTTFTFDGVDYTVQGYVLDTLALSSGLAATLASAARYTDDAASTLSATIAPLVAHASYDAAAHRLVFTNTANETVATVDATPFIKDGMVQSVAISGGNLVISFNTDAGADPISIPLADIFNPANYYTKSETDTKLAAKYNASGGTISGNVDVGTFEAKKNLLVHGTLKVGHVNARITGNMAAGVAVNNTCTASGNQSFVQGNSTTASAYSCVAIGTKAAATADSSFAWGGGNATNSMMVNGKYTVNKQGAFGINPVGGTAGFYIGDQTLASLLAAKQPLLTFDDAPTADSQNPVTSGGVKSALDATDVAIAAKRDKTDLAYGTGAVFDMTGDFLAARVYFDAVGESPSRVTIFNADGSIHSDATASEIVNGKDGWTHSQSYDWLYLLQIGTNAHAEFKYNASVFSGFELYGHGGFNGYVVTALNGSDYMQTAYNGTITKRPVTLALSSDVLRLESDVSRLASSVAEKRDAANLSVRLEQGMPPLGSGKFDVTLSGSESRHLELVWDIDRAFWTVRDQGHAGRVIIEYDFDEGRYYLKERIPSEQPGMFNGSEVEVHFDANGATSVTIGSITYAVQGYKYRQVSVDDFSGVGKFNSIALMTDIRAERERAERTEQAHTQSIDNSTSRIAALESRGYLATDENGNVYAVIPGQTDQPASSNPNEE